MNDLVKINEAAKAINVNKYFLYKAVASGKLFPYRAGRALRFDIEELRQWMKEQEKKV